MMLKKVGAILFHAVLTLLVYKIHVNEKVNSMLNDFKAELDQGYLNEVYLFHKTGQAAFMKRPITTFLIEKIHQFFSIEIGTSFVVLNFSCLFLSSLLLFYLSKQLTKSTLKAYLNSLVFFTCFPILFLFFVPIYTYDEPLQLVFLFAALLAFFKKKELLFLILITVSVFVRESTLILLPGFLLLYLFESEVSASNVFSKNNIRKAIFIAIPALIYFSAMKFYVYYFHLAPIVVSENNRRWNCMTENFESNKAIFESISAFFLVLLIPVYFLVTTKISKLLSNENKKFISAFLITFLLNTLISFSLTKVREARVLMLPLIFLWPIFSQVFLVKIKLIFSSENWIKLFKNPLLWLLLSGMLYYGYELAFFNYKATIGFPKDHYFNHYFFSVIIFFSIHLCLFIASKQKKAVSM